MARRPTPQVSRRPGFFELADLEIHPSSVRLLPRSFCRREGVLVASPVRPGEEGPVLLAMVRPEDERVAREAAQKLGRAVEVIQLTQYEIDRVLVEHDEGVSGLDSAVVGRVLQAPGPATHTDSSATELVDRLLLEAVAAGASDIHLESYAHDVDLRFRVDGLLQQVFTHITPENLTEVIARVMVMAELDIADRRRPQDGRCRVTVVGDGPARTLDLRVHVTPSLTGQDVVIRVLETSRALLPLRDLGLDAELLTTWRRLLLSPGGLLLVTGPTGSGKTTTLYASLTELVGETRKIITAEDPVEYVLDHVNQKQASTFLPFSELLRASLRQNPDVLLYGELRDVESAGTAVTAAGTGHLVLSTLHTGDAMGVIPRLRGFGIDDIDLAEALLGILAQRLVRRLCPSCREVAEPSAAQQALFGPWLEGEVLYRAKGCGACRGKGYRGRVGIYELLVADQGLADLIAAGASGGELRSHARSRGHRSLLHSAMSHVRQGLTSLDEVERVLPYRQLRD